VVDDDTSCLVRASVRLIGVDTETKRPNTPIEYFGKEASAFQAARGEGDTLGIDQANHLGHKDQYGRTLGISS
jgi:micrococcal nuclease